MSSYYGSRVADRAVSAFFSWAKRNRLEVDQPGSSSVDVEIGEDGLKLITIPGRFGVQAQYKELKSGRLWRVG